MEYYTYQSLGFDNIPILLRPHTFSGSNEYSTIGIRKPEKNVVGFLIRKIFDYLNQTGHLQNDDYSIVGIAYFMDDRAVVVHNGDTDRRSLFFAAEFSGRTSSEVHRQVFPFVNARRPEGLMIIQELPSENEDYHFRIVHDRERDCALAEIINIKDRRRKNQ